MGTTRRHLTVPVEVAALDIGTLFAGNEREGLPPIGHAGGDVEFIRESNLDLFVQVERRTELVGAKTAGVEAGGVRNVRVVGIAENPVEPGRAGAIEARPQRDVEGVVQVVVEGAPSERRAEIIGPPARRTPETAGRRDVDHIGPELRQEPVRINGRPVPVGNRLAKEPVAGPDSRRPPAERIELSTPGRVDRQPEIDERHQVFGQAVTHMVVRLADGVVLLDDDAVGVDFVGIARDVLIAGFGPGSVGRLPKPVFGKQAERAAAEFEPPAAVDVRGGSVVREVLAHHVAPDIGIDERCEDAVLHDQVDDAGNRVGAVLSRGAVAEDFDPVDGAGGKGVEIDTGRPGRPAEGEGVDQRRPMPPEPVDQHQRVIGRETPHREGTNDIVGVGDALAREVDRGRHRLEDRAQLAGALFRDHLGREHVHRNGQLIRRGVPGARSDHHVDRGQLHRRLGDRQIDVDGRVGGHVDRDRRGTVADDPGPHRLGTDRDTANRVPAIGRGGDPERRPIDRNDRPVHPGAGGIDHLAANETGLGRHGGRHPKPKCCRHSENPPRHAHRLSPPFRTIDPPWITISIRSSAPMSRSGSPRMMTRSANLPTAIDPTRSSQPISRAASIVAD